MTVRAPDKPASVGLNQKRFLFALLVLAAALAFDLYYGLPNAGRDAGIDYRVFSRAATAPLDQLYRSGHMPFVYPPTALFLFKPLGLLPERGGFLAWGAISAILFAWGVAKLEGRGAALVPFFSPAAVKGLILGQSAMLLGAALFWSLLLPPVTGGLLLGAVLAIKPQLLLFAPLAFLVRREWKIVGGMAIGSIGLVLASLIVFGPGLWATWAGALPAFKETLVVDGVLDRVVTPAGRAEWVGMPAWPFILIGLGLGTAAIFSFARKLEGAPLVALIVTASLVASPYAHVHDTLPLVPACVILMFRGPWWAAVLAGVAFVGVAGLTMMSMLTGLLGLLVLTYLEVRRKPHAEKAP